MRIIAHRTLVLFYMEHADAKIALEEWFTKTRKAEWNTFSDVRKTFNSADLIGDQHFVFNIHGNDYRLVAVVKFKIKMVYIRYIGTHSDYNKISDHSKL